jgi:hypothetical protein
MTWVGHPDAMKDDMVFGWDVTEDYSDRKSIWVNLHQ